MEETRENVTLFAIFVQNITYLSQFFVTDTQDF